MVQHSYHLDLPLLLCVLCLRATPLSAMLLPLLHSNRGRTPEQVDRLLNTAQQLLFGLGCFLLAVSRGQGGVLQLSAVIAAGMSTDVV